MNKKQMIKFAKALKTAEDHGGLCLSAEYTRSTDKMIWQCKEGHIWRAPFQSVVKKGTWCSICARGEPATIERAFRAAEDNDGYCLSKMCSNNRDILTWQCKNGHIWEQTFNTVVNGKHWCAVCNIGIPATIKEAREKAASQGGKCLSKESELVNSRSKLLWQCELGHTWESTFDKVVRKNRWCHICNCPTPANIENARQKARDNGGECLSKESELINSKSKLLWKCESPDHPVWEASYAKIIYNEQWCPLCSSSKMQKKLAKIIGEIFGKRHKTIRPDWLRNPKTGYPLEIDIYVESQKIAIEYNGIQHYRPVTFFGGEEEFAETQERDKIKAQLIRNNPDKVKHYIIFTYKDKINKKSVIEKLNSAGVSINFLDIDRKRRNEVDMTTYTVGQMAKKIGKTTKTLQRWDKSGKFKAYRTPTNKRYYTHEQLLKFLGRKVNIQPKDLDIVKDKVVLITGGTGTLGRAITRRICDCAKKVIIYSRCELKQHNMSQDFSDYDNIRYLLGDVRDKERLNMSMRGVDICFHAACMKRIEKCTFNPLEAVKNNVIGSMNVVESCIENDVDRALMVSTDKACNAATLYGGTKFVAEQLFINGNNYSNRQSTLFMAVRYGNVYASNGSIRHIFKKQVEENNTIKITHPDMTRFFMTIDQAVDLNLFALNNSICGGEIFIPKMKAVNILRYAKLFYPDAKVEVMGLRGHEKIHEELISDTEINYTVDCGKYYKVVPPNVSIPGLGWYKGHVDEPKVKPFRYSSNLVEQFSDQEIFDLEGDYAAN